jgi:hypothetical protein
MSSNGNILFEQRERTIDYDTGSLKEERVHTLIKKTTPEFIMLFTQTSYSLRQANLTSAQSKLLFEVLTGGYILRDNRIDLSSGARDAIVANTGLSRNTVNKAIAKFVSEDLIIREAGKRTGHILNPYIFGKGRFQDLEKLRLEVTTEYDFKTLEASSKEKTTGVYKQSQELIESEHEIVDEKITNQDNQIHHLIEVAKVESCPMDKDEQVEKVEVIEEFVPLNSNEMSDHAFELEMLKEQNRAKELDNKSKELENESLKLKIELMKMEQKA